MNAPGTRYEVAPCYQCAKCSARCPAAAKMTMPPHRAIHLLSLVQENRIRSENTIWLCAASFACVTRCPNNIDIPGVFNQLRALEASRGTVRGIHIMAVKWEEIVPEIAERFGNGVRSAAA